VDRLLYAQLAAIDRDRHSGAAELALRAADALAAWQARHKPAARADLLEAARLLCHTQSMMAPLRRLANEAALAAEAGNPGAALTASLGRFRRLVAQGPRNIAGRFRRALGPRRKRIIVTYSYSSTVLRALIAARDRIQEVHCSEASPEREGIALAQKLARAGVRTCLTTDTYLPRVFTGATRRLLVVGADQVRERDFVNRQGTEALLREARRAGQACWVLADTSKFAPRRGLLLGDATAGWEESLLARPEKNLRAFRVVLSACPLEPGVRVLTERGWMTAGRVRREVTRIAVSPRLRELLG